VTLRKGDVYDVDTGKGPRAVLVVSLDGLAEAYPPWPSRCCTHRPHTPTRR
jgi:hypothetical protein